MTNTPDSADLAQEKTLPYKPVWEACNELVSLANAIEDAATTAISNSNCNELELILIRNAAGRVGLLADHMIDYSCCGQNHWLDLPDMKQSEGES